MLFKDAKLRDYAYYGTGGTCEVLYLPKSLEDAAKAYHAILESGRPYFLLGGGSNSLVVDEHWPGAVFGFAKLTEATVDGTSLVVQAGVSNTAVAELAFANSLAGAAWMNRLPGQIGGTVRMNARCYDGEISQIVREVKYLHRQSGVLTSSRHPKMFKGYKDTIFMESGHIVLEATLELSKGNPADIQAVMAACARDRISKAQFAYPTCGCVFKNDYDVGVSSGALLEAAGAKGMQMGGAEVSQGHSNFVYNKGASSKDILELTLAMRELVYEKFGVWMEYEMEILGRPSPSLTEALTKVRPARWRLDLLKPLRSKFRA